jgi:hypothetical protein
MRGFKDARCLRIIIIWNAIVYHSIKLNGKCEYLVNEIFPLGNLPLSIGGISMRLFGRAFLNEKIVTPSKTEKEFTFNAYVGGRCEYLGFGKRDKKDIIKRLTDTISIHTIPRKCWARNFLFVAAFIPRILCAIVDGRIEHGIYIAKFRQDNGRIPLLQIAKANMILKDSERLRIWN